jgi:FAD/FMN-containing dehydrogenase
MSSPLGTDVSCSVFTPEDAGYSPEVAGFNAAVHHAPDVVVAAESADDIAAAVRFARKHGHRAHVHATGHGARPAVSGGVLISTRRMSGFTIDAEKRIATIGAGTSWAPVIAAAAEHGLAPIAGSSATVGVAGYLIGGGLGPLSRSHGYSSDYLVGATVVTGTGELREGGAGQDADLLWALRGGKLGLGAITELRVRLVPLPALYAGALYFEEANIEAALRAWIDWTHTAHALVTTSVGIVRFPPVEAIPAPFRGRRILGLRFAYPGATDEGTRLAAPLRAAAPVYVDALGVLPPAQIARIHNDPTQPIPSWTTGMLLDRVDQALATVLLGDFGAGTNTPFRALEMRHLGEATRRDVAGGSALGGRSAGFTMSMIAADPALFASDVPRAAERITASVQDWVSSETNLNFAELSAETVARAWPPATRARLAELRRRYDPDGVFAHPDPEIDRLLR